MSDSIPYLGCKISLISKSEIRYEGILYTIDAQESIIALAKVQSFGTEDRQAEIAVAARNDIYEYIIFRGTDIKKIEICDAPKPNLLDPAIVGLQVQQHAAPTMAAAYQGASFNHQPLGPIGSHGTYYGSYGQQLGQQNFPSSGFPLGTSQPSELSSGIASSVGTVGGVNVEPQSPVGSSQPVPAPIGAPPLSGISSHSHQQDVLGGSRSSTPSLSRKSPVIDAGVQVSPPPPPQQAEKKRSSNQSSSQRTIHQQNQQQHQNQQQQQHQNQQQQQNQQNIQQQQNRQQHQQHQQQKTSNRSSRENDNHCGGYYKNAFGGISYLGPTKCFRYQYPGQYRGGMGTRGRPTRTSQPRGRGVFNQGNRPRQDQQQFEEEFDFEQANVEFEELRTQLAKTKIENGDKKDEKKDDSGHETATTGDESEDSSSSVYYDKRKSFFDSISCEALERSKGRSQRSDWRVERKINVQTFGVATARRGYYPRGRGGYYNRGGYYRNYNQGYYRGNNSSYRGSRGGGGNRDAMNSQSNRSSNFNGAVGGATGPPSTNVSSYASVAAK